MQTTRTSENSPLRIAAVTPGDGQGRIGITLCPGKTDPAAMSGPVARNLPTDLDAIRDWGATAVVSLITHEEIKYLGVSNLGKEVQDRHMEWWHAPIPDGEPPDPTFEREWAVAGEAIRDRLRLGFDVLVHCKGGLGRAGTIAARLLVELGADPGDAIRSVRGARSPDAIETTCQEKHVRQCKPRSPAVPPRAADGARVTRYAMRGGEPRGRHARARAGGADMTTLAPHAGRCTEAHARVTRYSGAGR